MRVIWKGLKQHYYPSIRPRIIWNILKGTRQAANTNALYLVALSHTQMTKSDCAMLMRRGGRRQRRWTCLPSSGKYLSWSRRQPPVPERENQTEEETPTSWKGKGGWGRGCERSLSLMTSHQKWSQTKCDILYDNVMVPLKPWRTLLCDCHASGWCGCVTPDLNSFNATRREREKHKSKAH